MFTVFFRPLTSQRNIPVMSLDIFHQFSESRLIPETDEKAGSIWGNTQYEERNVRIIQFAF